VFAAETLRTELKCGIFEFRICISTEVLAYVVGLLHVVDIIGSFVHYLVITGGVWIYCMWLYMG